MSITTRIISFLLVCSACMAQGQTKEREKYKSALKIGMTSVYVHDPARAFRFYTDTLGFSEVMFMPEAGIAIVASSADKDGTTLMLEPNENPIAKKYQEEIRKAGFPAIVLFADDVKREYERLSKLGVKFKKQPTETPWGVESVFDDNCGNWIQLHQRK